MYRFRRTVKLPLSGLVRGMVVLDVWDVPVRLMDIGPGLMGVRAAWVADMTGQTKGRHLLILDPHTMNATDGFRVLRRSLQDCPRPQVLVQPDTEQ